MRDTYSCCAAVRWLDEPGAFRVQEGVDNNSAFRRGARLMGTAEGTRRRYAHSIGEVDLLRQLAVVLALLATVVLTIAVTVRRRPHLPQQTLPRLLTVVAALVAAAGVCAVNTALPNTQADESFRARTWRDYSQRRDFRKLFRFAATVVLPLAPLRLPTMGLSLSLSSSSDSSSPSASSSSSPGAAGFTYASSSSSSSLGAPSETNLPAGGARCEEVKASEEMTDPALIWPDAAPKRPVSAARRAVHVQAGLPHRRCHRSAPAPQQEGHPRLLQLQQPELPGSRRRRAAPAAAALPWGGRPPVRAKRAREPVYSNRVLFRKSRPPRAHPLAPVHCVRLRWSSFGRRSLGGGAPHWVAAARAEINEENCKNRYFNHKLMKVGLQFAKSCDRPERDAPPV